MKNLILILFIFAYIRAFGQTDTISRGPVLYGDLNAKGEKTADQYNAHAIKIGLLEITSGMYGLTYEKELNDFLGIQAGVGLTGRNFLYGLGLTGAAEKSQQKSSNFPEGVPYVSDQYDNYYKYDDREARMGFYLLAEPKLYIHEYGFDGPYFGLNIQYRRYNYLAYATLPGDEYIEGRLLSGPNDIDEYENQLIAAINYGGQAAHRKTIVEYFIGLGVRNVKGLRRDVGYINDAAANRQVMVLSQNIRASRIFMQLGLRAGLWWK
jgi:hypothetical protein